MIVMATVNFIVAIGAIIGCAKAVQSAKDKDIVIRRYIIALEETSNAYSRAQKRALELEKENKELRAKAANRH